MSFPEPPIVGIGTSAGGIEALASFFAALPEEPNAAFLVVADLSPELRGRLANSLAASTAMPVAQVEHSAKLGGNHVYVVAPDRRIAIVDHSVVAVSFEQPGTRRTPIDHMFRSLAEHRSESVAYAVVLTGSEADSAAGAKAIKGAGGIVLVQDPEEAEYNSMPRHAIAAQAADFVLPVRDLATRLVELLNHRGRDLMLAEHNGDETALRRILAHLHVRTGHDFSRYKHATVLRRIARRLQVTGRDSLGAYYALLRDSAAEARSLFSDLLISVTTFFRDAEAFEALALKVIPQLFARQGNDGIRVWVPGCATGEEAYSIGILLLEEAERRGVRPEIQIFASDLDAAALSVARQGRYPTTIEADVSAERLRRYFQREGDRYQIRRELRDLVLFASHSILRDPPFSRLDLLSCRNLLIYLDRELQDQAQHTFYYALNLGGFLFLGSAENADHPSDFFAAVDRRARIYRSAAHPGQQQAASPLPLEPRLEASGGPATTYAPAGSTPAGNLALHLRMLEHAAPPSMLVEEQGLRVLHFSGTAGRFLQLRQGPISAAVLEVIRQELRLELQLALAQVFERGEATLSRPLTVKFDECSRRVHLQVKLVRQDDGQRCALVLFIEGAVLEEEARPAEAAFGAAHSHESVQQLRKDLRVARQRLRVSQDQFTEASAALQAANEELQSINHEYRSTSVELETSKEELQSMNVELQTLNRELKVKLESVSRGHSDLLNLMAATDYGTLFLDPMLCIKRFTPRLTELFNFTASDEGRPITDLTHRLEYDDLASHARLVLRTCVPVEREVRSRTGRWYSMRIRPYRTIDDKIDGVVATFVDMTALREVEHRLETLVEGMPQLVWRAVGDGEWTWASPQWTRFTGQPEAECRGWGWLEPLHPGDRSVARQAWSHAAELGGFEVEYRICAQSERGYRWFQTRATPVRDAGGKIIEWLGTSTDIHELRQLQDRQRTLVAELQHRTRNLIGVVHALADRTVSCSVDLDDFCARFSDRLRALMRVQGLLSRLNEGDRVTFDELIKSELIAVSGSLERVELDGPAGVRLRSSTTQTLAMALHELATNAVKYGALGQAQARLAIRWEIVSPDGRGRPMLRIEWRESGVDMPIPGATPRDGGQGRELIEEALPYQLDAKTTFELTADGAHCVILLPVSASSLDLRVA